MKKNIITLLIFIASFGLTGFGQGKVEDQVLEPINRLFKGMNLGDSSLVHSAFAPDITMATVFLDKSGAVQIHRETSLDGFLKAVGTPHDKAWNEPIWNVKVQVDGGFAQVWCDYAFYVGNTFSHCGVDAFHLVNTANGWKIFHLADTRRKADCQIPEEVERKFKN